MSNRVHINAPAGIIDIEGEKDFVEGLLGKLFPLFEGVGFGSRPVSDGSTSVTEDAGDDSVGPELSANPPRPKAKTKTSRASKGQTCAARILELRSSGFFASQKSISEIVSGLAAKGFAHDASTVSANAISMFNRKKMQRTKVGREWAYFWDNDQS
jgi:hypothetical protein